MSITPRSLLSRLWQRFGSGRVPGYVDHFDTTRVAGWAYDRQAPSSPAMLSLYVNGEPELNVMADIPREDVRAAGAGPLLCGFDFSLPRKLQDGNAYRVELRLAPDGPVLRNGTLQIEASGAAGEDMPGPVTGTHEGVAFFDSGRIAIVGWAVGCTRVTVAFDGAPPETIPLDRVVPGFGSGSRQGFRFPVPPGLRDGRPHAAEVFFDTGATPLDGSPVRFSVAPDRVFVTVAEVGEGEATLTLRDASGAAVAPEITVRGDGERLSLRQETAGFRVRWPEGTRALVVTDGAEEVLARFEILDGTLAEAPVPELPPGALSPETLSAASEAFGRFCGAPDARFDAPWYRWIRPETWALETPEALIAHYRDHGARDGIGPGPMFDEAAARRLYPAAAEAVHAGRLPCLFALELALGEGSLETLGGVAPRVRPVLARLAHDPAGEAGESFDADLAAALKAPEPEPLVARLPAPASALSPARSIYAAWLLRLDAPDETRAEIEREEHEMRREIASTALTRQPLVSIIMPSYNRAFAIAEAIQSVLDQSYPNWELIVSDDASEDRTPDVVREFDDPRIRYMKFLKSNGAGTRNKGLAHARGEFIAYLDSDNIWHPQFLDLMMRRLLANPGSSIAYSGYLDTEIVGTQVRLHAIARTNFRPVRLAAKNFMDLNTIVHHRRLYDWLGGFDGSLPRLQDWDLALRYTSIFRPIFVKYPGVFYRRNVAWGQVTHLFMGSGAQDTVNDKTRRRLEESHERLRIHWPAEGRITVFCGGTGGAAPTPAARIEAEALARLAAGLVHVDLVVAGGDPDLRLPGADPVRLHRHHVPEPLARDPVRLGRVLWGLLQGRPVLVTGYDDSFLRAVPGMDPAGTWRLRGSGEGSVLQGLGTPLIRFDLGALPIPLPGAAADGSGTGDPMILLLPPMLRKPEERADLHERIAREAARRGLAVLMPPEPATGAEDGIAGEWRVSDHGNWLAAPRSAGALLPDLLAGCRATACMAPVSELGPFELGLVNALQARRVPAAVLEDAGLAQQWIEARAAYQIRVNEPKWLFEKLGKLVGDSASFTLMQDRSRTVHSIVHHPDLVRERLAHALYRMLYDSPTREVIDGRN